MKTTSYPKDLPVLLSALLISASMLAALPQIELAWTGVKEAYGEQDFGLRILRGAMLVALANRDGANKPVGLDGRSSLYTTMFKLVIPAGIAGIQSQGCETSGLHFCSIKRLCSGQVTVHGTGFRHPCRNDGTFIARPDLCITTSDVHGKLVWNTSRSSLSACCVVHGKDRRQGVGA